MGKVFQRVYPFTTEMISGYINKLDLEGKSVLTVGSSGDQAFNSILVGASDVTVVDINENTKEFIKAKKDVLLTSTREEFYDKVLALDFPFALDEIHSKKAVTNMNLYMQSDENFEKLKGLIKTKDIEVTSDTDKHNDSCNKIKKIIRQEDIKVINDDIFKFNNVTKSYDRIIFSNILQNIRAFFTKEELVSGFKGSFDVWKNHLNEEGIIQLLYIYGYSASSFSSEEAFRLAVRQIEDMLGLITFESDRCEDAIVVYEKVK